MHKVYVAQDGSAYELSRAWSFIDGEMVETVPSDEEMLDLVNEWCLEPEVQE